MTVWLSPDLVVFNNTLKVVVNSDTATQREAGDRDAAGRRADTRGDRQHPYWAKASWPK